MKQKKGFKLRNICGENIIMAQGAENIDFNRIISLNESAAYLWEKVEGEDFDADKLARLLTEEYDVEEATAKEDARQLIEDWLEIGIISE